MPQWDAESIRRAAERDIRLMRGSERAARRARDIRGARRATIELALADIFSQSPALPIEMVRKALKARRIPHALTAQGKTTAVTQEARKHLGIQSWAIRLGALPEPLRAHVTAKNGGATIWSRLSYAETLEEFRGQKLVDGDASFLQ